MINTYSLSINKDDLRSLYSIRNSLGQFILLIMILATKQVELQD